MSGYIYKTEIDLAPDWKDAEDPISLTLQLDLTCTQHGEAPSGMFGPPEFYDPGCGPEFDLDEVRIVLGKDNKGKPVGDVVLKPKQFEAMFGKIADDLFELACDTAAETGEFG